MNAQLSESRRAELIALRDCLNKYGDWYYANTPHCLYVDTSRRRANWNVRRIHIRNKIHARLVK